MGLELDALDLHIMALEGLPRVTFESSFVNYPLTYDYVVKRTHYANTQKCELILSADLSLHLSLVLTYLPTVTMEMLPLFVTLALLTSS